MERIGVRVTMQGVVRHGRSMIYPFCRALTLTEFTSAADGMLLHKFQGPGIIFAKKRLGGLCDHNCTHFFRHSETLAKGLNFCHRWRLHR